MVSWTAESLVIAHHPDDYIDAEALRVEFGEVVVVQESLLVERGSVLVMDMRAMRCAVEMTADRFVGRMARPSEHQSQHGVNLLPPLLPDAEDSTWVEADIDGCWRIIDGQPCDTPVPRTDGLGLCQPCREALRDA